MFSRVSVINLHNHLFSWQVDKNFSIFCSHDFKYGLFFSQTAHHITLLKYKMKALQLIFVEMCPQYKVCWITQL